MPGRMDTTPLLIEAKRAVRLTRVPFDERDFDETWIQELLFRYPTVIPADDIEPVFAPLTPVARELSTPSGPLDIFYLSQDGYPTLVETKLWRNPEARRQVVAQIIDYATQLSKWSYGDLLAAVRRARPDLTEKDPIIQLMLEAYGQEWDQPRFVDIVSRNLTQGRLLLLIVGDGIREAVEDLAETLSGAPQLGFSLALVEMALFRQPGKDEPLVVQPRVVARTREVVRAVVEIRGGAKAGDVAVTTPPADDKSTQRVSLTEEAFFEKLSADTSPQVAAGFRGFVADLKSRGIVIVPGEASVALHFFDPASGARISFGSVYVHGRVDMFYVVYRFRSVGLDDQIGRSYLDNVARLVPGARVEVWDTKSGVGSAVKIGNGHVTIQQLLAQQAGWLAAIDRAIFDINDAALQAGRE